MKTKAQKVLDATARQVVYQALSLDEKIARAKSRQGKNTKELALLLKQKEKQAKT